MKIHHALVTAGGGPNDVSALRYAVELMRRIGAPGGRITLLHVNEAVSVQIAAVTGQEPHDVLELVTGLSFTELKAAITAVDGARAADDMEHAVDRDVCVEPLVEIGDASTEILRVCRERDVDLVVMARHAADKTGDRSVLHGVVRRVARNRERPVLLIDGSDGAPPRRIDRIAVTTDFSEDSVRGLHVVARIADTLGHDVVDAIHVVQPPRWLQLIAAGDDEQSRLDVLRKHAERELRREAASVDVFPKIESHLEIAVDVTTAIIDVAARSGADLLAIPSHGKGRVRAALLGSTSLRIAQLARIPLLLMPPDWLEEVAAQPD